MTPEVREWVAGVVTRERPEAPVLEVGSYDVNGTVRDLFPQPYLGVDMRVGPGVDAVHDMAEHVFEPRFNTLVCLETLEHCRYPIDVLANMCRSAVPGALFVGTWPFMFELHGYPDDYWRATPSGFKAALEEAGFVDVEVQLLWGTHSVAVARVPADKATVSVEIPAEFKALDNEAVAVPDGGVNWQDRA